MKTLLLFLAISTLAISLSAQITKTDTVKTDSLALQIKSDSVKTSLNQPGAVLSTDKDTTKIVLGKRIVTIIKDKEGNSQVIISDDKGNIQNTDDDSFEHHNEWKDKKHEKKHKKFDGHWGGIEFGINNYVNSKGSTVVASENKYLELYSSKSWEFNLNLVEQNIPLYKKNIGLVTGLGFQFNNYRFENTNYILTPNSPYYYVDTINTYKKNKLTTTYLVMPLIFEFQIPVGQKERALFFGIGATGGVKLGSKTKLIDEDGNEKKNRNDFNLNTFRYGLTARAGFGGLNVYANYSLQPLFENNRGPKLYPISVGISLTGNF